MPSAQFHNKFRQYHRWLGFFLAGIMAVYAISGVLLIFRKTDFLKFDQVKEQQLAANLPAEALAQALRLRDFEVVSERGTVIQFKGGEYDSQSGLAKVVRKDYPAPLAAFVKLHKATHKSPLFWLNIAFGTILLFFVISAFLMFMPRSPVFKNGLKIGLGGFVFALLVVMFA